MEHGIFNMRTYIKVCNCTWGCTDTVREPALKVDQAKNPLLQWGIEPALAGCQSDALPTELHAHIYVGGYMLVCM